MAKKRTAAKPHDLRLHATTVVPIAELKPHPRNYKKHPADQLAHLEASLKKYGQFRNVVIAEDGTILAGHGVTEAAVKLGWTEVTCIRLPLSPSSPEALKLLALDNELPKFAETDDRMLTDLLKEISDGGPEALLGTGYDQQMLTLLAMVTRPVGEIRDFNAAAEWAGGGMPEFNAGDPLHRLIMQFRTEEDRKAFVEKHSIEVLKKVSGGSKVAADNKTWSAWWPARQREDSASLRWTEGRGKKGKVVTR